MLISFFRSSFGAVLVPLPLPRLLNGQATDQRAPIRASIHLMSPARVLLHETTSPATSSSSPLLACLVAIICARTDTLTLVKKKRLTKRKQMQTTAMTTKRAHKWNYSIKWKKSKIERSERERSRERDGARQDWAKIIIIILNYKDCTRTEYNAMNRRVVIRGRL